MAQNVNNVRDKSGSCAVVILMIGDDVYVANTGDSRAIMSTHQGSKFVSISNDHKPSEEPERIRILKGGGQVY